MSSESSPAFLPFVARTQPVTYPRWTAPEDLSIHNFKWKAICWVLSRSSRTSWTHQLWQPSFFLFLLSFTSLLSAWASIAFFLTSLLGVPSIFLLTFSRAASRKTHLTWNERLTTKLQLLLTLSVQLNRTVWSSLATMLIRLLRSVIGPGKVYFYLCEHNRCVEELEATRRTFRLAHFTFLKWTSYLFSHETIYQYEIWQDKTFTFSKIGNPLVQSGYLLPAKH